MYKTFEEAREAASKFIGKYDVPPVVTESKLAKNSRKTTFNFRFFVNEVFTTDWQQYEDRSWYRMVEVLA